MSWLLRALLRSGGTVGVFACLTAGCALIMASGAVLFSGVTVQERVVRLAAADIVVGGSDQVVVSGARRTEKVSLPGRARLTAQTVAAITSWADDHDADAVVDHVSLAAVSGEPEAAIEVHSWSATRLGSPRLDVGGGRPAPGEVVVNPTLAREAGVETGEVMTLRTAAGVGSLRVSGVLVADSSGRPAAYVDDAVAAEWAGGDTASLVGVIGLDREPENAASELRALLGEVPVLVTTGAERAVLEHPDASRSRDGLTSIGGSLIVFVVVITMVVTASAMTTAVTARRRELALLRTLAVTPRGLVRGTVLESVLLAAAAVVVGVPVGLGATWLLDGALTLAGALHEEVDLRAGPLPILIAVAATVGLAALMSWATVRRLATLSPAQLTRSTGDADRRRSWPRRVAGWLLTLLGLALSLLPAFVPGLVPVAVAGGGGLLLAFGVSAIGRPVMAFVIRLLARLHERRGVGTPWLSGALLEASAGRIAAASAPLVLGMALALVQVAVPATIAAASERNAAAALRTDTAVTSVAGVVPEEVGGAPVARQQVSAWVDFLGAPEDLQFCALGIAVPVDPFLELPVVDGRWDGGPPLPGTTVISEFTAASLGIGPGEKLNLVLGDGTQIHPRVVATHAGGYGVADIVLPFAQVAGSRGAGSVGADVADAVLGAAVADVPRLAVATDAPELFSGTSVDQATVVSSLPLLVLLAYIGVSVAANLGQVVSARRRDFLTLQRLGVLRAQLRRALRFEACVLAAVCVGAGVVVALVPVVMIAWGMTRSLVPGVPLWFLLLSGTCLAALAVTATVVPGRQAHRR